VSAVVRSPALVHDATSATDARGRFLFRHVPADQRVVLSVLKPGFFLDGAADVGRRDVGRSVTLAAGQWRSNVHLCMWRWAEVTGRVQDEHGDAVAGIPVRVLWTTFVGGTAHLAGGPVATTDDQGVYRIGKLCPGTYVVMVPSVLSSAPPGREGREESEAATAAGRPSLEVGGQRLFLGVPPAFFPRAASFEEASEVELRTGEERQNVDFRVRPVRAGSIFGRLVPATAGPPSQVTLAPRGQFGPSVLIARRTESGIISFEDVSPGSYRVLSRQADARSGCQWAEASVTVPSGATTKVAMEWQPCFLGPGAGRGGQTWQHRAGGRAREVGSAERAERRRRRRSTL
jgi:hypothetical protein